MFYLFKSGSSWRVEANVLNNEDLTNIGSNNRWPFFVWFKLMHIITSSDGSSPDSDSDLDSRLEKFGRLRLESNTKGLGFKSTKAGLYLSKILTYYFFWLTVGIWNPTIWNPDLLMVVFQTVWNWMLDTQCPNDR